MVKALKINNDKFMPLRIDGEKVFQKQETVWNKIEDLKILNEMLNLVMIID